MARFDRQIQTVLRLVKKNGQPIVWVKGERPTNSLEPWKELDNWKNKENAVICFLPVDKENRQYINYIRGTDVPFGSMIGLMGAVDFEPSLKDTVERDGVILKIKSIDLLSPNGQKILYTIEFEQ